MDTNQPSSEPVFIHVKDNFKNFDKKAIAQFADEKILGREVITITLIQYIISPPAFKKKNSTEMK